MFGVQAAFEPGGLVCVQAAFEPAWVQKAPLAPPAWGKVLQSLEVLVTQVSGWEALLEEKQRLAALLDTGLGPPFRAEVRPQLARLSGHVAAQCARLADAVEGKLPLPQVSLACSPASLTGYAITSLGIAHCVQHNRPACSSASDPKA